MKLIDWIKTPLWALSADIIFLQTLDQLLQVTLYCSGCLGVRHSRHLASFSSLWNQSWSATKVVSLAHSHFQSIQSDWAKECLKAQFCRVPKFAAKQKYNPLIEHTTAPDEMQTGLLLSNEIFEIQFLVQMLQKEAWCKTKRRGRRLKRGLTLQKFSRSGSCARYYITKNGEPKYIVKASRWQRELREDFL